MGYDSQTKIANDQHFDKTFTVEIAEASTAIEILTPTSGKSLAVKGVLMATNDSAGRIRLYFQNDEDGNENTVAILYADDQPGYVPLLVKGDPDEKLYADSTVDDVAFILVNYKEE